MLDLTTREVIKMSNLYIKVEPVQQTVSTWTSERATPWVKDLSHLSKQEFDVCLKKIDEYMAKFDEVDLTEEEK